MHGRDETQGRQFRILALDGGGIRGIFTASYLATVEDLLPGRICDYFDLIVGTSTGGIIGLAIAFGIPARRVLNLYLERGPRIFGRGRTLGMILRPKYRNAQLARSLRDIFGERVLNEALTPVCIPSYELTNSYPRIWKDQHADDLVSWGDQPAWKIALATSAAPLYLPGIQIISGDSHVDGGLFANNPTLVGLTEAVQSFRQPLDRIRILSVGAGERAERIPYERARRMGLWHWRTAMYEHMLIAQARIAHEVASRLLPPGQYERVNIPLEHPYSLDDHRAARMLVEPGAQEARTRFSALKTRFFAQSATAGREQKAAIAARSPKAAPGGGTRR
ncbi:MAG TPA: CBASS cGAMP-activated phospholipase [Patescibacteria group bacterium]|nr:CBASS cGAMP-activated phospholipase [Patescibacteria group bacterium]